MLTFLKATLCFIQWHQGPSQHETRDFRTSHLQRVTVTASAAPMGVKVLQCFPWYRRCKERGKGRQCPPQAEQKSRLTSTASWGSESEGHGSMEGTNSFYSQKARVSFRHQMDGNLSAIDITY
ncbi:hypothetical protein GN956_G15326 [Arapaima gigas]